MLCAGMRDSCLRCRLRIVLLVLHRDCVVFCATEAVVQTVMLLSLPLRCQVDLGDTVSKAIKRNCQAFAVAEALGRVSKSSMLCYPHFGDIEFRRQLLLFFLEEGCQPPRMMLSVAKGLRK